MDKIETVLKEVLEEAKTGTVMIEERPYNILIPSNLVRYDEKCIPLLKEYICTCIKKRNMKQNDSIIKEIIALLLTNATYDDFNHFDKFIKKNISFYYQSKIDSECIKNLPFFGGNLNIESDIQSINQETPYLFKTNISNNKDNYQLPSISYGIDNDTCYIYAIQNKFKLDNLTSYQKKIKRLMYKLNQGLNDEDIRLVSPSSIVSLSIFLLVMEKKQINNIKIVKKLPIRYHAKEEALKKRIEFLKKQNSLNKLELLASIESLTLLNSKIQYNITHKFLTNFKRLQYHYNNLNVFDNDNYLDISVSKFKESNNYLLNSLVEAYQNSVIYSEKSL